MLPTTKRLIGSALAAVIAVSLTACGGGGGGSSPLPSSGSGTNNPSPTGQMGQAQMRILIPASSTSASRKGAYVSSSTQSITIAQNGTQIGEADLTVGSSNCSTGAGGSRTCTATFTAPVGTNQTFAVSMWDQAGGKGNKLSTGNVIATIQAGAVAQVPVTLDGVPNSTTAAVASATLPVGTAGSTTVVVEARDAANNVIIGPGGYSTPITLTIAGDTYSTLSLATTPSGSTSAQSGKTVSVTSPGQLVTLSYNGGTNVGSTITPSIGSTNGTAAAFAGSGMAAAQMYPSLMPASGFSSWFYPQDVAALSNGTAVALLQNRSSSCCPQTNAYLFGLASATSGFQKYFVGDTSDPYNPGTYTSPYASSAGVSVVTGMSANIQEWGNEQQHTLTADSNGNVVYGGSFTSTAASNGCGGGGGTLVSGTIGFLNPTAGTTKEYVLKGRIYGIQTDTSGNIWFIEASGTCNGTRLLPSGYGIGEYSVATGLHETDFAATGYSNVNPYAMSIKPDGSAMYVIDYNSDNLLKIPLPGISSYASASLNNSYYAQGMATAPDGTTLWYTGSSQGDNYYYGYIPGSAPSFGSAAVTEAIFPTPYFYGYDVVYADGSFWGAGYDNYGLGRWTFNSGSTAPQTQFYSTQATYYAEPYSLSAGAGFIWATDDDYYTLIAVQYGTTTNSSTTTTLSRTRRLGNISMTPGPKRTHAHRAR